MYKKYTTVSTARLEDCIAEIGQWTSANRLKLNTDKIHIRTPPKLPSSGVAQWFERRSLAGGLSLIYASSIVDM